ncbi:MAG: DUF4238 domain-containing protein [Tepidisphaeraceae bacterium]|jgi:hypothetical protein
MSQRRSGKHQHIVPQQMIRNFAGPDRKLVEMVKPGFQIGTRRRAPKGILFRDDFYRNANSDIDAEFLNPIEQKFAPVYPLILSREKLNGHQGAAFIDWVAAMLTRTQFISAVMPRVPSRLPDVLAAQFNSAKKVFDNIARTEWFSMYQDLFARGGWQWKYRRFPEACLVLSDHPVCITSVYQEGGQMVLVPMSSDVVLIGGARTAIENMRETTAAQFNFFFAGYANRSIFASDRSTLEKLTLLLSDDSPFPRQMVEAARQPFFGAPERLREQMQSDPMPKGFDFGEALRQHSASFGPYRWEIAQPDASQNP